MVRVAFPPLLEVAFPPVEESAQVVAKVAPFNILLILPQPVANTPEQKCSQVSAPWFIEADTVC